MTFFLVFLGLFGVFVGLSFIGWMFRVTTALETQSQCAQEQVKLSREVNQMQAEILRMNQIMSAQMHGPGKN